MTKGTVGMYINLKPENGEYDPRISLSDRNVQPRSQFYFVASRCVDGMKGLGLREGPYVMSGTNDKLPTREQIERRAREIYAERGCEAGRVGGLAHGRKRVAQG